MLDLFPVAAQIPEVARRSRQRRAEDRAQTSLAVDTARGFADHAVSESAERFRAARTSWLAAYPVDAAAFARAVPLPGGALPERHTVVAADGSQVAPDRHDAVLSGCCLLNVGRVVLPYGPGARRARLDARAEVLFLEDDTDEEPDAPSAAARTLGLRRFGREMAALAELIAEASGDDEAQPGARPAAAAVALTDGSLIAWALEDETGDDPAKQEALSALLETLEAARVHRVPLVGYVSGSGSRDAVNALRVAALCPEEAVDCARCPHPADALPCAPIRRATDAALFEGLLRPGERSPVFSSRGQRTGFSRVLRMYGEDHWAAFFYLHVGAEVARVEVPMWVAEDPASLALVHAVCLDQARKGGGYPVALAEAHERAVVHAADRTAFRSLLARAMVREGEAVTDSRKALSKRVRTV